ncbi:cyclopropane-fatty-acyl-phospholipid synthase family protein [Mycobacterium sp. 1245852.3]|uniref:SAM-dependent methyltransferase n=1 Tax=Mycobacterium sp. 1245852.3 TaxID=1856860 RepID=UPI0007FE7450|nr:class I SAM-dependent methyltransferase [Mycobacterium sp. 1245852.3]OBK05689.1 hypothetical protein A9W96_14420 [Mycobacterium sp. 1245852.3]
MTERHAPPSRDQIDYFDDVYAGQPPTGAPIAGAGWDCGRPQPTVVDLHAAGAIRGDVLDIGCGTGENALYLAGLGYRVTGLDASAAAIRHAGFKAAARGLAERVHFAVADARELSGFHGWFDTVIDSGLLHVFSDDDRRRYIAALGAVCRPGARVHIIAVSDAAPAGPGPRRLSAADLVEAFADWTLCSLERSVMVGALPGQHAQGGIPAWLLTVAPEPTSDGQPH